MNLKSFKIMKFQNRKKIFFIKIILLHCVIGQLKLFQEKLLQQKLVNSAVNPWCEFLF